MFECRNRTGFNMEKFILTIEYSRNNNSNGERPPGKDDENFLGNLINGVGQGVGMALVSEIPFDYLISLFSMI